MEISLDEPSVTNLEQDTAPNPMHIAFGDLGPEPLDGHRLKINTQKIQDAISQVAPSPEVFKDNSQNTIHQAAEYEVPQTVFEYVKNLRDKGRKLGTLPFDLWGAVSEEDARGMVQNTSFLNDAEKAEMFNLLGGGLPSISLETIKEEKEEKEVILLPEEPKVDGEHIARTRAMYIRELFAFEQASFEREFNIKELYKGLGAERPVPPLEIPQDLVLAKQSYIDAKSRAGVAFLETEESILLKSMKAWRKLSFDARLLLMKDFMVGEHTDTHTNVLSPSVILVNAETELSKPKVLDNSPKNDTSKVVPEPVSEAMPLEPLVKPAPASAPALGSEVYPLSFEGHSVEVARGNPDGSDNSVIRVFIDKKEIAWGRITAGGPQIAVHDTFRTNFLLADSLEERALKQVMPLIKTLKP